MNSKIVAVIPAHLASVRFPRKVLSEYHGMPMIEHVRRRALLCEGLEDVYVATCDSEIADVVQGYGGKVIYTSNTHKNGTTRVAEAVKGIDCSHVMLLQGDEPLLLPRHVELIIKAINNNPAGDAWNATGPIYNPNELDLHSFVKCVISNSERIITCFRRSPSYSNFEAQFTFTRKILGIIAYNKKFIDVLTKLAPSPIETAEFIEQMRIIENDFNLQSVAVEPSLPSVNEPHESEIVLKTLEFNPEQRQILSLIIDNM